MNIRILLVKSEMETRKMLLDIGEKVIFIMKWQRLDLIVNCCSGWEIELVGEELRYLVEISKQSLEEAICFILSCSQ